MSMNIVMYDKQLITCIILGGGVLLHPNWRENKKLHIPYVQMRSAGNLLIAN